MTHNIMVAYATKHGATEEIAEKISRTLIHAGLATDVRPVKSIHDLTPYSAVVLGSAVYAGNWRKEAVAFLHRFERELAQRPVWFFSSGPTGEGDPVALLDGWRFPQAQQSLADRVGPRDIVVFHGAIEPEKLDIGEQLLLRAVHAKTGDYRNWHSVVTWADEIGRTLLEGEPHPSYQTTTQ